VILPGCVRLDLPVLLDGLLDGSGCADTPLGPWATVLANRGHLDGLLRRTAARAKRVSQTSVRRAQTARSERSGQPRPLVVVQRDAVPTRGLRFTEQTSGRRAGAPPGTLINSTDHTPGVIQEEPDAVGRAA